jgi:hypothetical protein
LPEFVERQQKLKAVIAEADGLALDGIRISSPLAPQVKYNVYAALHLIAVHQRRHLWQAERVAEILLADNLAMPEGIEYVERIGPTPPRRGPLHCERK